MIVGSPASVVAPAPSMGPAMPPSPRPIAPNARPDAATKATQLERAREAMTPETSALLPDALLQARVGRATLAGKLNEQIRFRVRQQGEGVADWDLVPDSPLAHAILDSKAGPRLIRQLRTAMSTIGPFHDRSNLKGFILPDDIEGVIAARAVAFLEDPAEPQGLALARMGAGGDTKAASELLQAWREPMRQRAERAGAWNGEGWVSFLPHIARGMLVAAGAYAPHKRRESYLLDAKARVDYLAGNASHEVQHSVTDRTPAASFTWMEEGIANVFSRTPHIQERLSKQSGITLDNYTRRLERDPDFQTGWGPYVRPGNATRAERSQHRERMYVTSQEILRDLVAMAGAPMGTPEGDARAFELLQGKTLFYVPGRLADAIIAEHGLDPSVRGQLRDRIKRAIDLPGGAKDIATAFGIEYPRA
jgi:hypothetical protein